MSESSSAKGSCLCGKVKVVANAVNPKFTVCHCNSCRQWGGGPFFAVQCGTDVEISGAEHITRYTSSEWAKRAFCSSCGTHLFYQLNQTGAYNMPLGLFENVAGAEMSMQYFSDKRPEHYCFANQTAEMTESEIFAYFAEQV